MNSLLSQYVVTLFLSSSASLCVGQALSRIFYPKMIDNQDEIIWATVVCPYYWGLV